MRASLPQGSALLARQTLGPAQVHPTFSGLPNPIHLPLRPEFRLELGNGPKHVEQQTARGIAGVDMLIKHLELDLLAVEFGRDLTEMEG